MKPSVSYTIGISQPQRHLLDVTMVIDAVDTPTLQVQMAAWTPGSYLLREYARHVRQFRAAGPDGALAARKTDRLTWAIETNGADCVTVQYQVYGYELTVRTNHVDHTHAHIIPAATLMYVPERSGAASQVSVVAPAGWQIATGLDPLPGAERPTFLSDDIDHLFDSPFEVGLHERHEFSVDGKTHAIVIWGHGNEDPGRLVADTRRIVEAERDFWGGLPYEHYTFFLMLGGPNAGGGLEHRNSTSLLLPRHIFKPRKSYERFLSLTAHEFFHVWNVKRLRAAPLGPFDYTRENYTRQLWMMEGITEYYTDLVLVRAGLMGHDRYLERLAEDIVTLQTTPGRAQHSLSDSSFDAWIKFYRPDETTPNTTISYYLKGAMAALVLDMALRSRSANATSLDDVLRHLYEAYPISGPGIPEADGMLRALQAVAPGDWDWFFERYIDGVEELPFDEALRTVGLALQWGYKDPAENGDEPQPKLGARIKPLDGRLLLTHVLDGGAADAAGLAANDEIIALNSWRVDEALLNARLADYAVGDTVQVTFFRNDVLHALPLTFNAPPRDRLTLVPVSSVSPEQRRAHRSWLGQPLEADGSPAGRSPSAVGTDEISRAAVRPPT
ncbi:MAG TPA: PDZ domain-containing protein [Herpetosiphonaceae bacterium]|nr:PDZ domain-containing protein [Herpetosiphonaceae bacterium]